MVRGCCGGVLCGCVDVLRTPDECFTSLPGFPFAPHYLMTADGLRVHVIDEGPRDAGPVLLLHGEPTWSYLYRHMIPPLVAAGHRVVAADLVGFGRSDKPVERTAHSYAAHVQWIADVVRALDLHDTTLVCQDWGGLIGLRVVADEGDRFARVVAANTGLPTGDDHMPRAFFRWRELSQTVQPFAVGSIVNAGWTSDLDDAVIAAYGAPFPDDRYTAGPRQMPMLVPVTPDDPAAAANRAAWEHLEKWSKPFLCAFSDGDPITRGGDEQFRSRIPGCDGQPHTTISGAGHFLQEDRGAELADVVVRFTAAS
jgi:haloalkane dehalogenase